MSSTDLRRQTLTLYRRYIRAARSFPIPEAALRRKLQYNVRLMFKIRKTQKDPILIQQWHRQAHDDLRFMSLLYAQRPDVLKLLFRKGTADKKKPG